MGSSCSCPECKTLAPKYTIIDGCQGQPTGECLNIGAQCNAYKGIQMTESMCLMPGAHTMVYRNDPSNGGFLDKNQCYHQLGGQWFGLFPTDSQPDPGFCAVPFEKYQT